MVAHSGLITVMQRAARKAAPRLRRDFGEVEQLQVSRKGPADFVSMADKRAEQTIVEELRNARPDWGMLLEEVRRDRGQSRQAAVDRRSARWHDQLPPRRAAFLDLDRGRGAEAGRRERDHAGAGLPAADRRELLGREGPGRLAAGRAAARVRPARPQRRPDRHGHSALRSRRAPKVGPRFTPRLLRKSPGFAASARPRSTSPGSPRDAWTASGKTTSTSGTPPPACLLVREAGGFVTDYRGGDRSFERREYVAASGAIHSKLQKLIAGALR